MAKARGIEDNSTWREREEFSEQPSQQVGIHQRGFHLLLKNELEISVFYDANV